MNRTYMELLRDTDTALDALLALTYQLPQGTPAYARCLFLAWPAIWDAERNGDRIARRNLRTARRFVRGQIAAQARATYRQAN